MFILFSAQKALFYVGKKSFRFLSRIPIRTNYSTNLGPLSDYHSRPGWRQLMAGVVAGTVRGPFNIHRLVQ